MLGSTLGKIMTVLGTLPYILAPSLYNISASPLSSANPTGHHSFLLSRKTISLGQGELHFQKGPWKGHYLNIKVGT